MNKLVALALAGAFTVATLTPGVASAHGASVYTGTTGNLLDTGGSFARCVSRFVGTFRGAVNVQLSGFTFDYRYSDHHIDRVAMRIESVNYNRFTGNVAFCIRGAYDDKNDDDDFWWKGDYTIVAVN